MAGFDSIFKDIFLAGVGAAAITGEKAKEVVDTLIEKGGITVEQGKEINTELKRKGAETVGKIREDAVSAQVQAMSPEERADFAAAVSRIVAEANAGETLSADEVQVEPESAPGAEAAQESQAHDTDK